LRPGRGGLDQAGDLAFLEDALGQGIEPLSYIERDLGLPGIEIHFAVFSRQFLRQKISAFI